ncbi:MAG: carboxypeptidase-like regulatory domain-containing protein [Gammaproteobacteria bacterium]|nr:carboxypeptidase-like regulatory domain-containing protein [Gammaproteobacteria bacterium]
MGLFRLCFLTLCPLASIFLISCTPDRSSQTEPTFDSNDIGGVVSSLTGPEAGVWVIAETADLGTRFAKIVVTDAEGQFVMPDLPEANYQVWVRGYGLDDSAKTPARPGARLELTVAPAASLASAAEVYPAAYWYSMMKLPTEAELESIPGGLNQYLTWMKNMGCVGCHQMGQKSTRTLPSSLAALESSEEAWQQRIRSGQAGNNMVRLAAGLLQGLPIKYLADWTDRVEAGELPHEIPARPSGLERNVVATVRDWSTAAAYMHDLSGTDRRKPTVNGNGLIYGAPELSTDDMPILDPVANTTSHFTVPVRDADTPTTNSQPVVGPSPYWGDEAIWDSKANIHNPMLDQDGRVWLTARIRGPENPDYCREGSEHPSAKRFPTTRTGRHVAVFDPATGEYQFVDTCFSTHHLQFAEDEDNTLWTSGGGQVVGWVNTRRFLATGDSAASQGWAPLILDTNGNGRQDEWVEPNEAVNPELDKRVPARFYAVMPNPADGSVWGSNAFRYPGSIVRYDPATNLGEIYHVPLPGFGVRGADIDREGVIWVSLGSGHLGQFDRRKCTGPLNGTAATGDHCPEGWTFHDLPGPAFIDLPGFSVESSYYTWVDQHNTLGLGANVPIVTGNLFDGVHALVDGGFITLRIPYPMGFYTKGFEGRIDDVDGGWKARGIWVSSGDRTPWLMEGGKGSKPLVVNFQMRPDPLAH